MDNNSIVQIDYIDVPLGNYKIATTESFLPYR